MTNPDFSSVSQGEVHFGIPPKKMAAFRAYFDRIKKGLSPDQARNDFELTIDEVNNFDFSVFSNG